MTYDEVVKKYPKIFSEDFYIEANEGWVDLIDTLSFNIQRYIDRKNGTVEQVVAMQVKSKFSGLRYYVVGGDEKTQGMIEMAESFSYHVCELCSGKGKHRSGGWIVNYCDKCYDHAASLLK